jgi:hypothetical protein
MKFYRLMMENTEDLGRLIVSEALCHLYLLLIPFTDLGERQALGRSKSMYELRIQSISYGSLGRKHV